MKQKSNEANLEFSLLLAAYEGRDRIETEDWTMNIFDDGTIIGTLYVRPTKSTKFITLEVKPTNDDRFEAKFKPFSVIQEETEIRDFSESTGTDMERRFLMFLLLNPSYTEKLNVEIKKKLARKLKNL